MKKQGFLQCSAILIISVIVSKAVGALFRIPLANLIGGVGMGYFPSLPLKKPSNPYKIRV